MGTRVILVSVAFLFITGPGAVDSWLSLIDRFFGKDKQVTINTGDWYQALFPILGLIIIGVGLWWTRDKREVLVNSTDDGNGSTPLVSISQPELPTPDVPVVSNPQSRGTGRSRPILVNLEPGASDATLTNMTGHGDIDMINNEGAPGMVASGIHLTAPSVGPNSNWLIEVAEGDKASPEAAVFVDNIGILWRLNDTTGAYYFEFQVHFFNGSVYDLYPCIRVEGNLSINGTTLLPIPEIHERPIEFGNMVPHAKRSYVELRQDLTTMKPTVERLRDREGQKAGFRFGSLQLISELRTSTGDVVATFPLELRRRTGSTPYIHGDEIKFTHPPPTPDTEGSQNQEAE